MLYRATRLSPALLLLLVVACGAEDAAGPRYKSRAGAGGTGDLENPIGGSGGSAGGGAASGSTGSAGSAGSVAGGNGGSVSIGDDCAAISQTATNQLQPADIIFAIDNSGSMDEEIAFVRAELNRFSQLITDSGIDVRIIVISSALQDPNAPLPVDWDGDSDEQDNGICIDAPLGSGSCPEDSAAPRYLHVPQEVKSSNALNLFVETYSQWSGQLRANATKTFVVVTDDDATDDPLSSASAFTSAVAGLVPALGAFTFSGIYCFTECPDAAEIGRVYIDLVAQTAGVAGDLCLQDFAPVFDALAESVIGASRLDCEWTIPTPPMGQTLQVGLVNVQYTPSSTGVGETVLHRDDVGACADQEGWHYDQNGAPTKVIACPATCTRLQTDENAKIDVLFGCETLDGPD